MRVYACRDVFGEESGFEETSQKTKTLRHHIIVLEKNEDIFQLAMGSIRHPGRVQRAECMYLKGRSVMSKSFRLIDKIW